MIPGVRMVYVDGLSRGLVGLEEIYRNADAEMKARAGVGAEEIQHLLVEEAAQRNYIPGQMRDKYAQALWADFRVWRGDLAPADAMREAGVVVVRILGQGCPNCERLTALSMEILDEMGVAADIAHVKSLAEIAEYGPVATPALVVNGQVVISGAVPGRATVAARLKAALEGAG